MSEINDRTAQIRARLDEIMALLEEIDTLAPQPEPEPEPTPDPEPEPDPTPEPVEPEPEPTPVVLANPQASVLSNSQIKVSWTEVPGATGYRVGRDTGGGELMGWDTVDPAGTTSRLFMYLTPNAPYVFSVQALPNGPVETVTATTKDVVVEPTPPPAPAVGDGIGSPVGLPILGICVNGNDGPQTDSDLIRLRALAGPNNEMWFRDALGYTGNDPTNGTKDKLRLVRKHKFRFLARLSLGSNPATVTADGYRKHVAAVLAAVKAEGWTKDEIMFEYHNEYLHNDTQTRHYVNMAKAVYQLIKDAGYQVIGGSQNVYISSGFGTWLELAYSLGFGHYTDGLSWHDYAPQGIYTRTNKMWEILKRYGQDKKLIWMTETGSTSHGKHDGRATSYDGLSAEGGMSLAGQARRNTELLKALGKDWPQIEKVFLYVDLDRPGTDMSVHEQEFGLIHQDTSFNRVPKDSYYAIQDLYDS